MEQSNIMDKFFNYSVEPTVTLVEEYDKGVLKAILDNYDDLFERIGKFRDFKDGYRKIEDKNRNKTILENLYKSKKVDYKPSINCKDGRLFGSNSLQGINKIVRHTLCKGIYYDYDIENCHNKLLTFYCDNYGIPLMNLKEYNSNREKYLKLIMDEFNISRGDSKDVVLSMLNGGGDWVTTVDKPMDWIYNLKLELRNALSQICNMECNIKKYKTICKKKSFNPEGTTINHILCKMENIVLQCMKRYCDNHNVAVGTLCFDGLLTKSQIDCEDIQNYIKQELGIELRIVEKPMDDGIDMEPYIKKKLGLDIDVSKIRIDKDDDYYWTDFVREHNKVFDGYDELCLNIKKNVPRVLAMLTMGRGFYLKKESNCNLYNLLGINELKVYFKYNNGKKVKTVSLEDIYTELELPLYSQPEMSIKEGIDRNSYNIYSGIQAIRVPYIDMELIQKFMDILFTLYCNEDQECFHFLKSQLRWMMVHPDVITKVFTILYSKQGYGKTTLSKFMMDFVFGHRNSITISGIKELTCHFNKHLLGMQFVSVEELPTTSDKFHSQFEEAKKIITDKKISITAKNKDTFQTNNYINAFGCTNNKFSLKVESGDERYFLLEIANKMSPEFWNDFYDNFMNQDFGNMLYSYFLETKDEDYISFRSRPKIPITKLKEDVIEHSMPNHEKFHSDIKNGDYKLSKSILKTPFTYNKKEYQYASTKSQLYTEFLIWANKNGITQNIQKKYLDYTELKNNKVGRFIDLKEHIDDLNDNHFKDRKV